MIKGFVQSVTLAAAPLGLPDQIAQFLTDPTWESCQTRQELIHTDFYREAVNLCQIPRRRHSSIHPDAAKSVFRVPYYFQDLSGMIRSIEKACGGELGARLSEASKSIFIYTERGSELQGSDGKARRLTDAVFETPITLEKLHALADELKPMVDSDRYKHFVHLSAQLEALQQKTHTLITNSANELPLSDQTLDAIKAQNEELRTAKQAYEAQLEDLRSLWK